MASNKKVITLGLDYSQFEGGISDVNRKMALLDSQFRLASEQVKEYGDETDKLTLKQEQLTQKINLQTQKVNISRDAYEKALASGKATDKQLDNLLKAYNNNQTALQKLNNELNDNKEKLEQASDSSESFGDSIRNVASTLGIDVNPQVEALASKFDGLDSNMGTAVLTIGTVITAFAGMTISAASTAQELKTLSSVTGLSTDTIQKFNYASTELNIEMDSLSDALKEVTNKSLEARDGSEELNNIFKSLGISVTDAKGNLISAEETFYKTIDALGKITNETERDAIAMKLFGEEARKLNPLIEVGSDRLRELGIQAEDLGLVLGESSVNSLAEFNSSMQQIDQTVENVKARVGLSLLPVFQAFADILSSIPTPVLAGIFVFGSLVTVMMTVVKAVSTMTIANAALSASNTTVGITATLASIGMGKLLLIVLAVAAAIALITGAVSGITSAMNEVKNATSGVVNASDATLQGLQNASSRSQYSGNYRPTRNNYSGTDYYEGGYTWINEGKPELVKLPRGSTIFNGAQTERLMSGGDNYYISINARDVKEFNDVIQMMQSYKQTVRKGVVKLG